MGKKESASRLIKALGKTKKEQMAKLYPKVKGDIRGKGPYVRGTIGKKGISSAQTFKARRDVLRGVQKKPKGIGITDIVGAGAAGFAVGKGWHKNLIGAVTGDRKKTTTHKGKAKKLAEFAIDFDSL